MGEGTGPRIVRGPGLPSNGVIEGVFAVVVRSAMEDVAQAVSRATQAVAASWTMFLSVPETRREIRWTEGG